MGVYQNPPKIFINPKTDTADGIFADLIQRIASNQGWKIKQVPCIWHQCLAWLESGQIDLMPDVALTEERKSRFDFHQTPVLISWSQVYALPDQQFSSILDLDQKRIAVLTDSVQSSSLKQLTESFHIEPRWFQVQGIEQGMTLIAERKVDAIATNNFFGDRRGVSELGLIATPILYQPSQLFFATPVGKKPEILATLDRFIADWKKDKNSEYYDIIRYWSGQPRQYTVPRSLWYVLAFLIVVLGIILVFTVLLRRQIEHKSSQLAEKEHYLNTILNNVDVHIFIKDRQRRYQYVNRKFCESLGLEENQILGKTDDAFFTEESCRSFLRSDLGVLQNGGRIAQEEIFQLKSQEEPQIFFSIKLPLHNESKENNALCGISTNITEYHLSRQQIHQLSFFDHLTGLPNRSSIIERLEHALSTYQKTLFEGALLLLEFKNFRKITASMGHEYGDQLLLSVAQRLQKNLKANYTVGRLDGDLFVILLENLNTDTEHAANAARSYALQTLDNLGVGKRDPEIPAYASPHIGIALFSDVHPEADNLLKAANLALHQAKQTDNNKLCFFNPSMQTEVNDRINLEHKLRDAIENNLLALYLQPQVDLSGNIVAMEALIRWNDSRHGWISPGIFIPLAEETDLIIELGNWVLKQSCHYLSIWQDHPATSAITLAINISTRQFKHPGFIEQVKACLRHYEINPDRLKFEITESLLIDDMEHIINLMAELKATGIRFSLDDFGTGYSSLAYLKRLPLYQLKIDQGFVRDLLSDPNDEAIVQTILLLGQSLHLEVIAEGVETEQQVEQLNRLGCQYFQGYYFGKPENFDYWTNQLTEGP